jgi:hypothetical protein
VNKTGFATAERNVKRWVHDADCQSSWATNPVGLEDAGSIAADPSSLLRTVSPASDSRLRSAPIYGTRGRATLTTFGVRFGARSDRSLVPGRGDTWLCESTETCGVDCSPPCVTCTAMTVLYRMNRYEIGDGILDLART